MKIKIYSLLFLLFCTIGLLSFTQEDEALKRLLLNFQKYTNTHIQEKVYLHTDKPYYAIGDAIWFKAYVVDAQTLSPTLQSNILYVDLINSRDSVKKTLRIPLVSGLGWGNFELKDSLQEGNYRLRAYTTWMRNFGEEYYFDRTIKVGNAWTNQLVTNTNYIYEKAGNAETVTANINFSNIDGFPYAKKEVSYNAEVDFRSLAKGKGITDDKGNITIKFVNDKPFLAKSGRLTTSIKLAEGTVVSKYIPIISTSNETAVQFFPESGNLVEGVRSRLAFKALGADGLGKEISGYLQDNEGNRIVNFASKHLGMGAFAFIPNAGKTYQAVVKFSDGSEKNFKIREAKPEGLVLSVTPNLQDSVLVKVSTNQIFAEKNMNKVYTVIAQNAGNIVYTATSKLTGLNFAAKLPQSRFLDGITQFTLFDENFFPIAERLIFSTPKNILNLSINPDKNNYTQRSKTKLTIKALQPNGTPTFGSFSIAVTDEGKVPIAEDEENTIFTNLLLSSDIKGYVENPNFYFHDVNDEKLADLDMLMMTQGWRRFDWKNISNGNYPTLNFKPEKTLSVAGRVTTGNKKTPVVGGTVTLFSSAGKSFLIQAKTNQNGEFLIDSLLFGDSTRFVVQGRTATGKKNVDIELYNKPPQIVTNNLNLPDLTVNINESMLAYLKNSKTQYEEWLKYGIVNRSILLNEVKVIDTKAAVTNSSNLNGAGFADRILTAKDFQYATTVDQALLGRVAGLNIIGGIAYIRGKEAQIIVDGIYLDPDYLSSINIQDVESIEILKSIGYTAIYGSRGGGGVIVINTKRGQGYVSSSYAPGIVTYSPIGLFNPKEFYVPNYDDPKINNQVADLRTTIYWNPNVITDKNGVSEVEFFNADGTGNYKVVLEGMDLNGHLGRKVIRYQVNSKN